MIDTRDKRASCLGLGVPGRVAYAEPTGNTLNTPAGRQAAAYLYAGIPVGSDAPDADNCYFMPQTMGAGSVDEPAVVNPDAVAADFCFTFAGF